MRLAPLMLLTWASVASAAGTAGDPIPELTLDWQATPSCATEAQLREDVARILRGAPRAERPLTVRARAIRVADGTWHVDIVTEVDGSSHRRAFDAESCAAVESAFSLILVFAIDPRAEPAASASEAAAPGGVSAKAPSVIAGAPSRAPAAGQSAIPLSPPPPRAAARGDHSLGISAGVAFDSGTLPAFTEGTRLALGFYPGSWRLELSAADWLHRTATAAGTQSGARFGLLSAATRIGYTRPLSSFRIGLELSAQLSQLKANGFSGSGGAQFERSELSAGVGAGGVLAWRASDRLELQLLAEELSWLTRPTFVVSEPNAAEPARVYRPSAVSAQAAFAACVRFF